MHALRAYIVFVLGEEGAGRGRGIIALTHNH